MRLKTNTLAIALLSSVFMVGCQPTSPPTDGPQPDLHEDHDQADGHDGHAHPEHGPNGGELFELGAEEYHAELLHDDDAQTVTINLLDSAAKEAVKARRFPALSRSTARRHSEPCARSATTQPCTISTAQT